MLCSGYRLRSTCAQHCWRYVAEYHLDKIRLQSGFVLLNPLNVSIHAVYFSRRHSCTRRVSSFHVRPKPFEHYDFQVSTAQEVETFYCVILAGRKSPKPSRNLESQTSQKQLIGNEVRHFNRTRVSLYNKLSTFTVTLLENLSRISKSNAT
jgi:hypothetical protein